MYLPPPSPITMIVRLWKPSCVYLSYNISRLVTASGTDIYSEKMDIYAPCALGATINDDTVFNMKAKVIAGAANNQLATEERHGVLLRERGIVYAPDFLINAGGIINVYAELEGYDKQEIMRKTENIYNTTLEILETANREVLTTNRAALNIAKQRIEDRKKVNFK